MNTNLYLISLIIFIAMSITSCKNSLNESPGVSLSKYREITKKEFFKDLKSKKIREVRCKGERNIDIDEMDSLLNTNDTIVYRWLQNDEDSMIALVTIYNRFSSNTTFFKIERAEKKLRFKSNSHEEFENPKGPMACFDIIQPGEKIVYAIRKDHNLFEGDIHYLESIKYYSFKDKTFKVFWFDIITLELITNAEQFTKRFKDEVTRESYQLATESLANVMQLNDEPSHYEAEKLDTIYKLKRKFEEAWYFK